jgi:hypothetical protein
VSASRAAWTRTLTGVFFVVLAVAWAAGDAAHATAVTGPTPAHVSSAAPVAKPVAVKPAPVIEPRVTSVEVCDGAILVTFDAVLRVGREEFAILDNGRAKLQLHEISGRSQGPDYAGRWYTRHATGGEHMLRWPRYQESQGKGAHWDAVRVVVAGYTSPAVDIVEECTA